MAGDVTPEVKTGNDLTSRSHFLLTYSPPIRCTLHYLNLTRCYYPANIRPAFALNCLKRSLFSFPIFYPFTRPSLCSSVLPPLLPLSCVATFLLFLILSFYLFFLSMIMMRMHFGYLLFTTFYLFVFLSCSMY